MNSCLLICSCLIRRSKQSFRFADTPVSLLFEEVSESRNFIHKELFRFQGYEELIYFGKLWVLLPLSRRNTKDSANYGQPLHPELIPNYSFHVVKLFTMTSASHHCIHFLTPPQVGDDNPSHDMPGAGAVTTDPSQSVERGIHDNSNRPSNHVMVESLPGDVTEQNDTPVSSDMSSAESLEADGVHSAKKPHHG
ncbi:uncharacterized protein LOC103834375 isoform X2 [Brassica rapa]|uniref:uncharacterized protein LOC103834375 isoform X2 n=1 Tax=Brassica campestris TaxID=3711 RepID=UPI00142DBE98|nr:uncharacterized protein LOC103834375 isoform X2 [Brassica rapa]